MFALVAVQEWVWLAALGGLCVGQLVYHVVVVNRFRKQLRVLQYENRDCRTHGDYQDLLKAHQELTHERNLLECRLLRQRLEEVAAEQQESIARAWRDMQQQDNVASDSRSDVERIFGRWPFSTPEQETEQ